MCLFILSGSESNNRDLSDVKLDQKEANKFLNRRKRGWGWNPIEKAEEKKEEISEEISEKRETVEETREKYGR